MPLRRSAIILALAILSAAPAAIAQTSPPTVIHQTVLPGVPDYLWNYGCGPTAAGMLLGYWQRQNEALYPLIDYKDPQNRRAPVPLDDHLLRQRPVSRFFGPNSWNFSHGDLQLDQFIAGYGHSRDYWDFDHPAESPSSLGVDPMLERHPDNSLADFLHTSRGLTKANGMTWPWDLAAGLKTYSESKGFTPARGYAIQSGVTLLPTFDQLAAEITHGNPVILLVDLQGCWLTMDWHYVTAYGIQDLGPQGQWIAVRDTWKSNRPYSYFPIDAKLADGIRWWKWNAAPLSNKAAIRGLITFHLDPQLRR